MKLENIGIASLMALLCYIGLSFFLGPYGTEPFDTLLEYRDELIENVDRLEAKQNHLLNQKNWLEHDSSSGDELLYGIGLLREEQNRIRIAGYDLDPLYQSPGSVLSLQRNHEPPYVMMMSFALAVFIIVLLLTTVLSNGDRKIYRKSGLSNVGSRLNQLDSLRTFAGHSSRVQTASRE